MNYPDNVDFRAMERSAGFDADDRRAAREYVESEFQEAMTILCRIESLRAEIARISLRPNARIPNHYPCSMTVKPTTWADIDLMLADISDALGLSDDEMIDLYWRNA